MNRTKKILFALLAAAAGTVIILAVFLFRHQKVNMEQVYEVYSQVREGLRSIEESYRTEDGTVPSEDLEPLLDELEKAASQYQDQDLITGYSRENSGIYMELEHCVGYLYSPSVKDSMAGGSVSSPALSDPARASGVTRSPASSSASSAFSDLTAASGLPGEILTVEPYANNAEFISNYVLNGLKSPDHTAAIVANALPETYTFTRANNRDSFSYEDSSVLSRKSIIIWYGHGDYTDLYGPVLGSTLESTEENMVLYSMELASFDGKAEMIISGDYLAFTPWYFEHHLEDGSLNGSLVYLAACHSMQDSRLADVFLKKGASLTAGATDKISISYNLYMMTDFFTGLTTLDENGNYMTANEALDYAQGLNGSTDFALFGCHASVILRYASEEETYRLIPAAGENQTVFPDPEESSEDQDPAGAAGYLQDTVLPRYQYTSGSFSLNYELISGDYTDTYFYQCENEYVAFLGSSFYDFDQNGTEDLLTLTMETTTSDMEKQMLGNRTDLGVLSLAETIYTFDQDGALLHTYRYHSQITPVLKEQIDVWQIGNHMISLWASDDDSASSDTRNNDEHSDDLYLITINCNEEKEIERDRDWYNRRFGFLSNDGQYFSQLRHFVSGEPDPDILYAGGMSGETGLFAAEEDACGQIRQNAEAVLGTDAFTLLPCTWETRWENPFFQFNGSSDLHITLKADSTNTFHSGTAGTTTFSLSQ